MLRQLLLGTDMSACNITIYALIMGLIGAHRTTSEHNVRLTTVVALAHCHDHELGSAQKSA
jgi:hypothetical protein